MPRWIVFDQITAAELRSRLPHAAVFEAPGRAPLEYALDNPKSLITVLPPSPGNRSAIAVFRPQRIAAPPPAQAFPVRATGFLGLNDEFVSDEEVSEKRSWWQFWKE